MVSKITAVLIQPTCTKKLYKHLFVNGIKIHQQTKKKKNKEKKDKNFDFQKQALYTIQRLLNYGMHEHRCERFHSEWTV